jgi:hypothetical protein
MSGETEIRPFTVDTPNGAIAELRRRIAATRWPGKELMAAVVLAPGLQDLGAEQRRALRHRGLGARDEPRVPVRGDRAGANR